MKVEHMTAEELDVIGKEIGDSFFDHAYGVQEGGLVAVVGSRENMQNYMTACLKMGYKSGILYTTSENKEGFIIVDTPKHPMKALPMLEMFCSIIRTFGFKRSKVFMKTLSRGGKSYRDGLKKQKVKHAYLYMLVVRNEYKGQGYMRKLMEMLYEIADKERLPVVFDTDAENKMEKYVHLGTTLVKTRDCGDGVVLYDLFREAAQ